MVITVCVINVVLAAIAFYAAWQIWQLRQTLSNVADVLLDAERSTHEVLCDAPEAIAIGQVGTYQLREKCKQLDGQLRKVRQIIGLLGLGQQILKRTQRSRRRSAARSQRYRPR